MENNKKLWDAASSSILKSIPNPSKEAYENKIRGTEVTFLGVDGQPDFATIWIDFYPNKKVIELKSLKQYFYQYRDIIISYERFINIVYDHLKEVYDPHRLRISSVFNIRGGFSSKLTIDSDWKARGGAESFEDWKKQGETW